MNQLPTPITRTDFEQWVAHACNKVNTPSVRKVAKIAGVSKSRLSYQLTANQIDSHIIIEVSRGLHRQPLKDLSLFSGYQSLAEKPRTPKTEELLTLVSNRDIYAEISRRLGLEPAAKKLDTTTKSQTWHAWFKQAVPKASYAELKELTGVSQAMIARNHSAGNWSIEQILSMASHYNFSPHLGLVAAGKITFGEAGYPDTLAERTLSAASAEQLQFRLEKIATSLAQDIEDYTERELTHAVVEYLA